MPTGNFEFQRNLPFTEFLENGSWVQKRDPASFLLGFLLLFTAVLITQNWLVISAAIVLVLVLMILSKTSPVLYLNSYVKALPLILVVAIINLLINPTVDNSIIILRIWIIKISSQDIQLSLFLVARFTIIMLLISVTTANFSISRFIHGLEDILSPLSFVRIPVHDFIVSIEIAIRYIPLLTLTAERIAKAQASRGATWGTRKAAIIERIRQVLPLVVPLFIQSFHKAEKIALAMDARGYGIINKRSRYHTSRVVFDDILIVLIQIGILFWAIFSLIGNS